MSETQLEHQEMESEENALLATFEGKLHLVFTNSAF